MNAEAETVANLYQHGELSSVAMPTLMLTVMTVMVRHTESGPVDVKSGLVLARTETRPDYSTHCPDENPHGNPVFGKMSTKHGKCTHNTQ